MGALKTKPCVSVRWQKMLILTILIIFLTIFLLLALFIPNILIHGRKAGEGNDYYKKPLGNKVLTRFGIDVISVDLLCN